MGTRAKDGQGSPSEARPSQGRDLSGRQSVCCLLSVGISSLLGETGLPRELAGSSYLFLLGKPGFRLRPMVNYTLWFFSWGLYILSRPPSPWHDRGWSITHLYNQWEYFRGHVLYIPLGIFISFLKRRKWWTIIVLQGTDPFLMWQKSVNTLRRSEHQRNMPKRPNQCLTAKSYVQWKVLWRLSGAAPRDAEKDNVLQTCWCHFLHVMRRGQKSPNGLRPWQYHPWRQLLFPGGEKASQTGTVLI